MNGIGAALLSNAHDLSCIEIAADGPGLACHLHMQRFSIGLRKDRDSFNSHLTQRRRHAYCDSAAVRDETFADHFPLFRSGGWDLPFFSDFSIQGGFCRSRNAFIPACPSTPARECAMASAANSIEVSRPRTARP